MILIGFQEIEPGKAIVMSMVYDAETRLEDFERAGGIMVESLPIPEHKEGKMSVLLINPDTKELWYDYQEIPPREPTENEKLQLQIDELKALISAMNK
jgi:hypothetical protein